jgi:hypothetical protein
LTGATKALVTWLVVVLAMAATKERMLNLYVDSMVMLGEKRMVWLVSCPRRERERERERESCHSAATKCKQGLCWSIKKAKK